MGCGAVRSLEGGGMCMGLWRAQASEGRICKERMVGAKVGAREDRVWVEIDHPGS